MRSLSNSSKNIEVSFGIVNCNRLYYLRSCLESLLETTKTFDNMEVIIVDNASVEPGTTEYLDLCKQHGIKVIRKPIRNPSNEFAQGLNTIVKESVGWILVPLQGDMQFILPGWLEDYVQFANKYAKHIGSISLDAQRLVTINSHQLTRTNNPKFYIDNSRNPVAGAADCLYIRENLKIIGPWCEDNKQHEGGNDSETDYLQRFQQLRETNGKLRCLRAVVPTISPAAAIYTDLRGTNARVRGDRRYGDYWPSQRDWMYYEVRDDLVNVDVNTLTRPMSIEEVVRTVGFDAPIDCNGSWKKNPIDPKNAQPYDYVVI
jgi:glycosyltransferase involved in cell wall biosynthesis